MRTEPDRIPVSTYRVQLHRGFTFRDAAALVPYLSALGVTDCYASPFLMANPGSTHGYDICDHGRLNPELGGDAEFARWSSALGSADLGLILDFVPNHMGIDPRFNRWWHDVLENGPSSPYAHYFDIDWDPVKTELENRVLLPILGDQYGLVLERGELTIGLTDGAFEVRYFDHRLPVNPRQSPRILLEGLDELRRTMGESDADLRELLSVITGLQHLPAFTERDLVKIAERQREKEVARERLARLVEHAPRIKTYIDACLARVNGAVGRPASFDALHDLLEAQAYRLAYWRTAFDEINYRRFFDVNELAGLRMEESEVFAAAHGLILRLVERGLVTGLRIDHPDGLFDPAKYFRELQAAVQGRRAGTPKADRSLYVVAEKILSAGEDLPGDWAVHGTTGYDFLNELNGLFVDPAGVARLSRIFARVSGRSTAAAEVVYACKKLIMQTSMASELNVLAHALNRLSERDRRSRDFTLNSLRRALMEVVACFPIYRTYVTAADEGEATRSVLATAIRSARRRNSELDTSIFHFILRMLRPDDEGANGTGTGVPLADRVDFARKFQQYTGPVQAKGLEDTAFYRHAVLLSANEVGGDPARVSRSVQAFHAANLARQARWPFALTSTTTHDTKRGEDGRARLNALSEVPDEWRRHVSAWMRLNARGRTVIDREPVPDRGDEYLFYQSLLGAWPAEPHAAPVPIAAPDAIVERMKAFMTKALREAKVHSSWVNENAAYEDATLAFVDHALGGRGAANFLGSFVPFARRVADRGMVNGLAQLVLKLVSPGVPDFYQGSELWDTSLVDPDNRRPVDYAHRHALLDRMHPLLAAADARLEAGLGPEDPACSAAVAEMLAGWQDGRIKLFMTAVGLRLRRRLPDLFLRGEYIPLDTQPADDLRLVACARMHDGSALIALVPRLSVRIDRQTVALPAALGALVYRDLITGEVVRPAPIGGVPHVMAAQALRTCPVALLWGRRV